MATYTIEKDSVKKLGDKKVGMTVTFTDEKNGKKDCTCYHEVESQDADAIEASLKIAALEYEARLPEADKTLNVKTNETVQA